MCCAVVLHWPKYTPHTAQLQWTYQVSRPAIHISVSLVMTVNAAPCGRGSYCKHFVTWLPNFKTKPVINRPFGKRLIDCDWDFRCFLCIMFHFWLESTIWRLLDAVVRFARQWGALNINMLTVRVQGLKRTAPLQFPCKCHARIGS